MDWNEMSDDSWLQEDSSEDEDQKPELANATKVQDPLENKQSTELTHKNQSTQPQSNEDAIKKQKHEKKEGKKQSRKFPTDQELLSLYQNNKVQQNKRIKVINFNEEDKKMIQNMLKDKQIKKIRPTKDNIWILTFWNKQDLMKFIEKKIQASYKFKVGIYIITQKEKQWKAEKQKEKEKNQQKKKEQRRDDRQHRTKKPEYRGKGEVESDKKEQEKKQLRKKKDQEEKKGKEKEERKENPKNKNEPRLDHKQEHKQEQKYKEKDMDRKHKQIKNIQLENERSNILAVLSEQGNPSQVVEWIREKQIPKRFNQFILVASGYLVQYMDRLCQQCYKSLRYGLISDINQQECQKNPEGKFQYRLSSEKKPKQVKKLLAGAYLQRQGQEYFETYQKFNTHIIGNKNNPCQAVDFDEKQYIESFKKSYPKLVTKWQKWIFYAFGKNIAKLLRLSGTVKKLLEKNQFAYEIGASEKGPFLRFEISDFNKTKYKVDTSVVNSHLQDA